MSDKKILKILISTSEEGNRKFNDNLNNLLDVALNDNSRLENRIEKISVLKKRNQELQRQSIEYLLNKGCLYEDQFSKCGQKGKNIDASFLFEDSKEILDVLYDHLIK